MPSSAPLAYRLHLTSRRHGVVRLDPPHPAMNPTAHVPGPAASPVRLGEGNTGRQQQHVQGLQLTLGPRSYLPPDRPLLKGVLPQAKDVRWDGLEYLLVVRDTRRLPHA